MGKHMHHYFYSLMNLGRTHAHTTNDGKDEKKIWIYSPLSPPQMTAMSLIQSLEEHNEVMLFIPILEKLPASLITMCQIKNIKSVN